MSSDSLTSRLRRRLARMIAPAEPAPPSLIGGHGCLEAAASFVAWNQIPGDYLEFGVWRGDSFAAAWHAMERHRRIVANQGFGDEAFRRWQQALPRFFAFDSFEGLPGGDAERHADYAPGAYRCTLDDFRTNLSARGVDLGRVSTLKGYYDQTLHSDARSQLGLDKAAIVMIDCDLYESTVPVLEFLTPLLQQGTVIIFDDWFRYRGSPAKGEQRACREWLAANPAIELVEHWRQGPQSMSFIVNFDHDQGQGALRGRPANP